MPQDANIPNRRKLGIAIVESIFLTGKLAKIFVSILAVPRFDTNLVRFEFHLSTALILTTIINCLSPKYEPFTMMVLALMHIKYMQSSS